MSHTHDTLPDRVSQTFANRTILITGVTGFLGKVLIEKLLRQCPEIKKIYTLVRPKAQLTSKERLEKILIDPLFDAHKKQMPRQIRDKLGTISGDLSYPDLGVSEDDRRILIDETEIIYHSGATVKFEEPLAKMVLINVRGTKLMLELAQQCPKLMIFCHSSTAYCHEDQDIVYERFYEPSANPHQVIKLCETMDSKHLDTLAHWTRDRHANNYSFTKALGEALVKEQINRLPIIVHRPSLVNPTWSDPFPGWTDNLNGIMGLSAAAGKGVVRTIYGDMGVYGDFVPVDFVVAAMIGSTFDFLTNGSCRIYNLTNAGDYSLSSGDILKKGQSTFRNKVPFDHFLWYPTCNMTTNRLLHNTRFYLTQLFPAVFVDLLLRLFGIEPALIRVQRKFVNSQKILEYHFSRSWNFDKTNVKTLIHRLNEREKESYRIALNGVDIDEYFVDVAMGFRRFIFKEKDENLGRAMICMKTMRYVDKFCKIFVVATFLYYVYSYIFK